MFNVKLDSPSKILRNVKRIAKFNEKKKREKFNCHKFLSISTLESIDILPKNLELDVFVLPATDIPPTTSPKSNLEFTRNQAVSIPPRPVYHPAIFNASEAIFGKHLDDLTPEEFNKFNVYRRHQSIIGKPLEEQTIYLPDGGMRSCVNCGELT